MLFRRETLEGIASGKVTLAFRRWKRPTIKAQGSVRTAAGVVGIGEIDVCDASTLTEADAQASGFASLAALRKMLGPEDGNPVYRIELTGIAADQRVAPRSDAEPTEAEWTKIRTSFARWDKIAPGYFPSILHLIGERPETAAVRLAAEVGQEKLKFKQDVRKLKELGLTESRDTGYRLSPRGRTVMKWVRNR